MEITEQQINEAYLDCLFHWEENVKNFPKEGTSRNEKQSWFFSNCMGNNCALCKLCVDKDGETDCNLCPLKQDNRSCFHEWDCAASATDLEIHHIQTVRDRIKDDCRKRGLL